MRATWDCKSESMSVCRSCELYVCLHVCLSQRIPLLHACVACHPMLVRLEVVRRALKINISGVPVRRRDTSMPQELWSHQPVIRVIAMNTYQLTYKAFENEITQLLKSSTSRTDTFFEGQKQNCRAETKWPQMRTWGLAGKQMHRP